MKRVRRIRRTARNTQSSKPIQPHLTQPIAEFRNLKR